MRCEVQIETVPFPLTYFMLHKFLSIQLQKKYLNIVSSFEQEQQKYKLQDRAHETL